MVLRLGNLAAIVSKINKVSWSLKEKQLMFFDSNKMSFQGRKKECWKTCICNHELKNPIYKCDVFDIKQ